jgi:hypothetical protein
MRISKDRLLDFYPAIAATMFELATGGQIIRMIREKSALGQEPISWLLVSLGLFGWYQWYKVKTPDKKLAQWTAFISCWVNVIAFIISVYFKYYY